MKKYEPLEQLFKDRDVEILKVRYLPLDIIACAKIVRSDDVPHANKSLWEAMNHSYIKDFPKAIKFYETICEPSEDGELIISVIIMEFCSNGNLMAFLENKALEIEQINAQGLPYTETCMQIKNVRFTDTEILQNLKDFVLLLSALQKKNFCHRDIKPENIFITEEGELKLGDFGEAKTTFSFTNQTIRGSPLYFSPAVRQAYQEFIEGKRYFTLDHNPFKSDVYSLGLVFLYMATLEPIDESFIDLDNLSNVLESHLSLITNPRIKAILYVMLQIDENRRPDFFQLEEYMLYIMTKNFCYNCRAECLEDYVTCRNCKALCHCKCITNQSCSCCGASFVCSHCQIRHVAPGGQCEHYYCEKCQEENIECDGCVGFSLVDVGRNTAPVLEEGAFCICINCGRNLQFDPRSKCFRCEVCCYNYCGICKNYDHYACPCILSVYNDRVFCNCQTECKKPQDDLFFPCSICGWKCLVCFENSGSKSHVECAEMMIKPKRLIMKWDRQFYGVVVGIREDSTFFVKIQDGQVFVSRMATVVKNIIDVFVGDLVLVDLIPNQMTRIITKYDEDDKIILREKNEVPFNI